MVADPPRGDAKGFAAAEPTANGAPTLVPIEDPGATRGGCCRSQDRVRRCLRANLLVLLTVVAVVAGVALGLGVSGAGGSQALGPERLAAFAFPGELLLRLLKMIILPLVVCSLIGGAASLDSSALGRLGAWALLFFLVTTLLASALGVGLALALRPGAAFAAINASVGTEGAVEEAPSKEVLDSFLDLVRSDPARPMESALGGRGRKGGARLCGEGTHVRDGGIGHVNRRGHPGGPGGRQDRMVWGGDGGWPLEGQVTAGEDRPPGRRLLMWAPGDLSGDPTGRLIGKDVLERENRVMLGDCVGREGT